MNLFNYIYIFQNIKLFLDEIDNINKDFVELLNVYGGF